jgi:hypothetical protein
MHVRGRLPPGARRLLPGARRLLRGLTPGPRSGLLSRAVAVVVCLLLAASLGQLPTASASTGRPSVGYRFPNDGFMGTYAVNGQATFCIDLNGQGPSTASGYLVGPAVGVRKQVGWTADHRGGNAGSLKGAPLTGTELGQLGYLTDRFAATTSATTAAAAEHVVRTLTVGDPAQAAREVVRWAQAVKAHPALAAAFATIWNQVAQQAGPYQVTTNWSTPPSISAAGVLKVQVRSAAGTPMTGVPVTARYPTPTGSAAVAGSTGTTGTALLTIPVAATGALTVTVTATGLASPVPLLYLPMNYADPRSRDYAAQRTVGPAPRVEVSGTATATVAPVVPTVTTQASAASVYTGAPVTDSVTVSGAAPGYGASVGASLWGPFAKKPTATSCQAPAVPVGQVSVAVAGNGTVTTPAVTSGVPGYYTWTEGFPASSTQSALTTPCGAATETIVVLPPAVPPVTTTAAPASPTIGDQLTDTLTVTGSAPGYTAPAVGSLWGPFATQPTAAACQSPAAPVATATATVTGDGTFTTGPATAAAPGYYTWTENLPASSDQAAVTTPCGAATETSLVPAQPAVVLATIGDLVPGDDAHAELTATGMFPQYAPAATVDLYGPFTTAPGASDCTAKTKLQQTSLPLPGDGTYDTADLPLTAIGYYTWTFTVPGNATQVAVSQTCGSGAGTVLVTRADLGALQVTNTSTQGSTAPTAGAPAAKDPQLDIPSAGIAAPLVAVGLAGTGIAVPADPAQAGELTAGATAGDSLGTIVVAGRVSDTHDAPGALFTLASVAPGAAVTLIDVNGKTRKFTVDTVTTLPRTQVLPATLFTQSTPLRLVILSATNPVWYGPGGSLVTHLDHVIVVAS